MSVVSSTQAVLTDPDEQEGLGFAAPGILMSRSPQLPMTEIEWSSSGDALGGKNVLEENCGSVGFDRDRSRNLRTLN